MKALELISGEYTPDQAKEILMNYINSKIHFYEIKDFSHIERYGKADPEISKRIKHLYGIRDSIISTLAEAKQENKCLVIESSITISYKELLKI